MDLHNLPFNHKYNHNLMDLQAPMARQLAELATVQIIPHIEYINKICIQVTKTALFFCSNTIQTIKPLNEKFLNTIS
jgi:hypothetical protein